MKIFYWAGLAAIVVGLWILGIDCNNLAWWLILAGIGGIVAYLEGCKK